jgi:hypothetical protein
MSRTQVYEENAQRCEKKAAAAQLETERYCWSMMAQAWLKLAASPSNEVGLLSSIRRLIAAGSSI